MYHNLKEGFDKYLSTSGLGAKVPEVAKKVLKHAWMDGATCILKEFAKLYRQNPKTAIALMQHLGHEAVGYDGQKDDLIKHIHEDMEAAEREAAEISHEGQPAQKHWGRWGGGWGWGLGMGYPYYGGYGWGGWPRYGWGVWKAGPQYSQYHDPRYAHTMEGYPSRQMHGYPQRYWDGRMYDKDHPYVRSTREHYPDIEASHYGHYGHYAPHHGYEGYEGKARHYGYEDGRYTHDGRHYDGRHYGQKDWDSEDWGEKARRHRDEHGRYTSGYGGRKEADFSTERDYEPPYQQQQPHIMHTPTSQPTGQPQTGQTYGAGQSGPTHGQTYTGR